jgi:hypothetical protein
MTGKVALTGLQTLVNHLFEELFSNGYIKEHAYESYVPWRNSLDSKFHHFSGYPPQYTATSNGVELMMCPPKTGGMVRRGS